MRYWLVSGDRGSKLLVTIRDALTKAAIDLTGKTVQLRCKINDGALQTMTMTVQPPAINGQAEYQFTASDVPEGTVGTLQGEVRVQPGEADQLTSLLPFPLEIRAPLS